MHSGERIPPNSTKLCPVPGSPLFQHSLLGEFAETVFSAANSHFFPNDDKEEFVSAILQPGRVYSASNLVASLKYTVKTHKAAGDVEWRPLHATVKTRLSGGMKFITWLLKPALRKLPHLVVNSCADCRT